MKPLLFHPSCSIFLFFVTFIISTNIPTCVSINDYTNCNKTYSCGSITNLTYPFWGGNRPGYCGEPNSEVTCESGVPKFSVNSVTYRIIGWDLKTQNLTVARDDLWDNLCLTSYHTTNFDGTVFHFDGGLGNVTLLYDCTANPPTFNSQGCNDGKVVYFSPRNFAFDYCTSVFVPIFGSQVATVTMNFNLIPQALRGGFGLDWENHDECNTCMDSGGVCAPYGGRFTCCKNGTSCTGSGDYENECIKCVGYGGKCGFDSDSNVPICICGDRMCPSQGEKNSKESDATGGKKSKVGVAVGAAAGAVALVAILGFGFVCFLAKRKKKIAASKQSRSGDLFTHPSSNGAFTSTTNMSQSFPSYTSSKTGSVPPMRSFYFGVQVFTIAELEEATGNFHPSRELGEGGFGTVYKGELKDGRVVAVKRHYESNFKRVQQFMNEVEILARLRHKNLVTLFGCTSRHSRELLLVYEFISNGTVADHLHGNRANSNFVSWTVRLDIAIETAEALAYLHASDVIHRDVKSNNILLDDKFRVKVADFGLSRLFPNDATHVSTAPQGTPGYVDPEYYQCYQLTDKSDVYSFGVVLIELISSLQAVDVNRHRNDVNLANMAINKIQNQEVYDLVDPYLGYDKDYCIRKMTTRVAELAFRCLQQQRDMRPSMDEVLKVLRGIKSDEPGATRESDVVNLRTEEVVLLKNVPYLLSSTDSFDDKWVSSSTTSNSS